MLSVVAILLLGLLHWIGVRELPRLALALAIAALVFEGGAGGGGARAAAADRLGSASGATSATWRSRAGASAAAGFAAAWLAFSGLESLGQLAPALREPRQRVIRIVAALVVVSLVVTVPRSRPSPSRRRRPAHIAPQPALLAAVARGYGGAGAAGRCCR